MILQPDSNLLYTIKFTAIPYGDVKWFKNGKEINTDLNTIITIENDLTKLLITNVSKINAGKYEVIISNVVGTAKSSGSVVISNKIDTSDTQPPIFEQQLYPQYVIENEIVILETTVKSYPLSSFQWFLNDKPIDNENGIKILNEENHSILMINEFNKNFAGIYTCRAENFSGSTTTSASVLIDENIVTNKPKEYLSPRFVEHIMPDTVMDGEKLFIPCKVIGQPIPKIEWFHNDIEIKEAKDIIFSQDNFGLCSLTISEVFPEDAGEYYCKATNKFGEALSKAFIKVEGILIYGYAQNNTNCHTCFSIHLIIIMVLLQY